MTVRKPLSNIGKVGIALFFFVIPANLLVFWASSVGVVPEIVQLPLVLILIGLVAAFFILMTRAHEHRVEDKQPSIWQGY